MSNSIVWIRHIEKLYKNGKADKNNKNQYQHDPGILMTEDTMTNVKSLILKLIESYGKPRRMIVSPYLRTRETTELILKVLKEMDIEPEIIYSTDIAEYLGFCKREYNKQEADLDLETVEHFNFKVYLGEGFNHFKKRLLNHINFIEKQNDNIWVITHGLVLSCIYEHLSFTYHKRPKPLDYIVKYENIIEKSF
jgi:broad specificity phosphatase PhoE